MAVYKKTYQRYDGPLTPAWSRFLVPARYSFEEMQGSRFLTMVLLGSSIWPLGCALFIYVQHNLSALKFMQIEATRIISIGPTFFLTFLGVQSMFTFILTSFVGPGLISPDLANNALPLYLARPFSRKEYVISKLFVLLSLLSLMTWIPGLLLYSLQGYLEGNAWFTENLRVASGLFFGSWIWILLISLLALALSAWVKWKPAAGALLFGVFFVAGAMGGVINAVLRTRWGNLLNISHLIGAVWVSLFEEPMKRGNGAVFFRVMAGEEIPISWCWVALIAMCGACLYMLARKIRGMEVVR